MVFYLAVFYVTKYSVVHKGFILFFLWPRGLFQLLRCNAKLGFVVLMFLLWGWKIGSPDWTRTKAQTKTCHKQESLSQSSECSNVTSTSAEGFSGCMPSKPFINQWTRRPTYFFLSLFQNVVSSLAAYIGSIQSMNLTTQVKLLTKN